MLLVGVVQARSGYGGDIEGSWFTLKSEGPLCAPHVRGGRTVFGHARTLITAWPRRIKDRRRNRGIRRDRMQTVVGAAQASVLGCEELGRMGLVNTFGCCERCHQADRHAPGLVAGPCRAPGWQGSLRPLREQKAPAREGESLKGSAGQSPGTHVWSSGRRGGGLSRPRGRSVKPIPG